MRPDPHHYLYSAFAYFLNGSTLRRTPVRIELLPPEAALPDAPSDTFQKCREIRRRVFVEGQSVPSEIEFDGLDPDARHFLAFGIVDGFEQAVGTARMRIVDGVAKAERIAVLDRAQRQGLGRGLVEAIEDYTRALGLRVIRLNAQVRVAQFYTLLGYESEGEVFIEAGIEHLAMRKSLS